MSEIHHVVTTCDRCGYQVRERTEERNQLHAVLSRIFEPTQP